MKNRTPGKRKALQAPRWARVLCDSAMRGGVPPPACPLVARESNARLAAEAANRAKDDFFLTLSHELRGPLTAIVNWVYLLRTGQLDAATAARALDAIERSVAAQANLVDDMLDVSRIVGAKLRLAPRPVDLASLVVACIETVSPALDDGGLRAEIDCRRPIDPIFADPARLQQVIRNLLLNAIKFTPEGGQITVRLGGDAEHATIAVCDTGRGIRPELLPHLFERFWQGDATAVDLGGLGLGLAIVKHLVDLHGGTVVAASEGEGKGATFTVTLPTNLTRQSLDAIDGESRPSTIAGAPQTPAGREAHQHRGDSQFQNAGTRQPPKPVPTLGCPRGARRLQT